MQRELGKISEAELEAFKEKFKVGFLEFLDFMEQFGDIPMPPDPSSMDMDDPRTLEELSLKEIAQARVVIFEELGIDPTRGSFELRSYKTIPPEDAVSPGEIDVHVLKTNREGVVLQELVFQDRVVRWLLGPDQDI